MAETIIEVETTAQPELTEAELEGILGGQAGEPCACNDACDATA
jgi:hypothetical protein